MQCLLAISIFYGLFLSVIDAARAGVKTTYTEKSPSGATGNFRKSQGPVSEGQRNDPSRESYIGFGERKFVSIDFEEESLSDSHHDSGDALIGCLWSFLKSSWGCRDYKDLEIN
jgi:hypothetical protein